MLELVYLKIFDQFSHSSFEIREFSHFNQILLSLFDVCMHFKIVFELFILFEIFLLYC